MAGPYYFGERSKRHLQSCNGLVVRICERVMDYQVMDFAVICGHRDQLAQMEAFAMGNSKRQWPNSIHNTYPSMAVDLAPYPIDWKDSLAFARLAGLMFAAHAEMSKTMAIPEKLRWGGDWDRDGESNDQSFMDIGHFELVNGG